MLCRLAHVQRGKYSHSLFTCNPQSHFLKNGMEENELLLMAARTGAGMAHNRQSTKLPRAPTHLTLGPNVAHSSFSSSSIVSTNVCVFVKCIFHKQGGGVGSFPKALSSFDNLLMS